MTRFALGNVIVLLGLALVGSSIRYALGAPTARITPSTTDAVDWTAIATYKSEEPITVCLRYHESTTNRLFYALLSRYPDTSGSVVEFEIQKGPDSQVQIYLMSGSAYVRDDVTPGILEASPDTPAAKTADDMRYWPWQRPRIKTTRAVALGEGSEYIVHVDASVDHIYDVSPSNTSGVEVTTFGQDGKPLNVAETKNAGFYLEVRDDGTIIPATAVPNATTNPLHQFYESAIALAEEMQLP